MDAKALAQMILSAAEIYEGSYDHAAADAQAALNDAERAAPDAGPYAGMGTDWKKFYKKSLMESCNEAAASAAEFAPLLGVLLYNSWNDAITWASEITGVDPSKKQGQ